MRRLLLALLTLSVAWSSDAHAYDQDAILKFKDGLAREVCYGETARTLLRCFQVREGDCPRMMAPAIETCTDKIIKQHPQGINSESERTTVSANTDECLFREFTRQHRAKKIKNVECSQF